MNYISEVFKEKKIAEKKLEMYFLLYFQVPMNWIIHPSIRPRSVAIKTGNLGSSPGPNKNISFLNIYKISALIF